MFGRKSRKEGESGSNTLAQENVVGSLEGRASDAQVDRDKAIGPAEGWGKTMNQSTSRTDVGDPSFETVIAKGVAVTGNIECKGSIQVFGTVNGDISARVVSLEGGSFVRGRVEAVSAFIAGKVEGVIDADAARFLASGSLDGELICKSLSVEEGAFLNGGISRRADEKKYADAAAVGISDKELDAPSAHEMTERQPDQSIGDGASGAPEAEAVTQNAPQFEAEFTQDASATEYPLDSSPTEQQQTEQVSLIVGR